MDGTSGTLTAPDLDLNMELIITDAAAAAAADIYIMVKCVSVCLSRKMIIVCLFVMFYGFAR